MDISEFTGRLRASLLNKGIPTDKADAYLKNLKKYLTPEDVENVTEAELEESAAVCAAQILNKISREAQKSAESAEMAPESAVSEDAEKDSVAVDISENEESANPDVILDIDVYEEVTESEDNTASDFSDGDRIDINGVDLSSDTAVFERVREAPAVKPDEFAVPTIQIPKVSANEDAETEDEDGDDEAIGNGINYSPVPDPGMYGEKFGSTPRGTAMFILVTVLSSPLWLIAGLIFFAPFLILFVTEIVLTAGLVCLLAGGAAAGSAAALVGIVYGIIQAFESPAVGMYEIGFGIIIGGVAMVCGILIYNGAVRLMPWVFRKTIALMKFVISKIKPILAEYKRRCKKL